MCFLKHDGEKEPNKHYSEWVQHDRDRIETQGGQDGEHEPRSKARTLVEICCETQNEQKEQAYHAVTAGIGGIFDEYRRGCDHACCQKSRMLVIQSPGYSVCCGHQEYSRKECGQAYHPRSAAEKQIRYMNQECMEQVIGGEVV